MQVVVTLMLCGSIALSSALSMCSRTPIAEAKRLALPGKSWLGCKITGVGAYAGEDTVPNDSFATLVDTSDAWISKRTGIRRRHVLQRDSSLRHISSSSASDALKNAGVDPADIDLVILATSSPDDLFGDAVSVAHAVSDIFFIYKVIIIICLVNAIHRLAPPKLQPSTSPPPARASCTDS